MEDYGWKKDGSAKDVSGLVIEKGKQKYKFLDPFKEPTLQKFFADFFADKLTPYVKSEPEPADNTAPVKIVTGLTFQKIVNDPDRDVLIEFYAPWCGHCKALAPTYDEVGKRYAKHADKVVIAKMDSTANDIPPTAGFTVSGFPTIKLIKAETNEVVDYEGDRTEESFLRFLAEHGTHQVDVSKDAEVEEDLKKVEEDVKKEEKEAKKEEEEEKKKAEHEEL